MGVVIWLSASICAAQQVLVAQPSADDQVLVESFHRLRAELRLEGFSVEVIQLPSPPNPLQARQAAEDADAFAAVILLRAAGETTVDVWITDRLTGKMVLQTLRLDNVDDAPSVLALRAVDLLRNSLLELRKETPPPQEIVGVDRGPVPEQVERFTRQPRSYRLGLGALLHRAGALGEGWGASIAIQRRVAERLRVGLMFGGPLLGGEWSSELGSVTTHQEILLAEISYDAARWGPLSVCPNVGAGGFHLSASGDVEAPLRAQQDRVLSAAITAGLALDLHLGSTLLLTGQARALVLTPRPGIALDTDRMRLALPSWMASLGMGVEF